MASAQRLSYIARYPFLPEAREYLSAYGFTLENLADPAYSKILDLAFTRVKNALERGENVEPLEEVNHEDVLASYALAVALVAASGDRFLARRFALAEASLAQRFLNQALEEGDVGEVLEIARKLGMDVEPEEEVVGGVHYGYSIGVADYLKGASAFNDPNWKLVNRVVREGRVLIEARELTRLMRDRVEARVLEALSRVEEEGVKLPPKLEALVNQLKSMLPERRIDEERIKATAKPAAWPPCMKAIYSKLVSGESVSHFANFALASFLLNAGVPPEEVVSIYSRRSDFDERVARYQVEHIAGRRGSRTRYTTPSCGKMRTNGLCIEDGKICGGVKNPLTYYRRALRRMRKGDKGKAEKRGKRG